MNAFLDIPVRRSRDSGEKGTACPETGNRLSGEKETVL
jgi:hypothetical protein